MLAQKYPETYDPSIPLDLVYSGTKQLMDTIESSDLNVGKLVLSPTRTYAPNLLELILDKYRSKISGMVHCGGELQTKVLHL